jgi:hypothetical protein
MYDALNENVEVGYKVVYSDSAGETSSLKSGIVIGFTEKKIRIKTLRPLWQRERQGDFMDILKFPEQVAVVERNVV